MACHEEHVHLKCFSPGRRGMEAALRPWNKGLIAGLALGNRHLKESDTVSSSRRAAGLPGAGGIRPAPGVLGFPGRSPAVLPQAAKPPLLVRSELRNLRGLSPVIANEGNGGYITLACAEMDNARIPPPLPGRGVCPPGRRSAGRIGVGLWRRRFLPMDGFSSDRGDSLGLFFPGDASASPGIPAFSAPEATGPDALAAENRGPETGGTPTGRHGRCHEMARCRFPAAVACPWAWMPWRDKSGWSPGNGERWRRPGGEIPAGFPSF